VQRASDLNLKALLQTVKQDGVFNLYKGYWVTLGTFGPYSALYFLVYEQMRSILAKANNQRVDSLSFNSYLLAAAVSSAAAAFVTTPFDVVKTRYQVQRRAEAAKQAIPEHLIYKSTIDGFSKILKHEGFGALWKGLGARIAYNAPNAAIIMSMCK